MRELRFTSVGRRVASIAFVAAFALLVALSSGCSSTVPAQPHPQRAPTCKVRSGESREQVLEKCGLACGSGSIPEGSCGDGEFFSRCANECDVYGTVAVCYVEGKVVKVLKLRGAGTGHVPTCAW